LKSRLLAYVPLLRSCRHTKKGIVVAPLALPHYGAGATAQTTLLPATLPLRRPAAPPDFPPRAAVLWQNATGLHLSGEKSADNIVTSMPPDGEEMPACQTPLSLY